MHLHGDYIKLTLIGNNSKKKYHIIYNRVPNKYLNFANATL